MQFNTEYQNFLRELDNLHEKTLYARVTALTINELPIETIEGRITQGSINIDGNSALRRTCSLTLVAQELNYNDFYWGLNTKFKLEVGVENNLNPVYPKIIWFKQGIYLITSFNTSHATNNYTISIQGKDKMCQLNGEVSGSLTNTVDFGTLETVDAQGNVIITKIPIKDIIRNMVHQFAGEPMHNIIINDLEDYGLELLEYRYDKPLYLYRPIDSLCYNNILIDGNKTCYVNGMETTLGKVENYHFDTLVETTIGTINPTPIQFSPGIDADKYYIAKIEYGHTAGYRPTELTYTGDLIGNVGDSITSILDKIKNMLGQFEYFYNIDGKFVFQKKQSLINTLWTPQENKQADATYKASLATQSTHQYIFTESNLIISFNNNPNLLNLRNDYSIHGTRTTAQGAEIPINMRYAIDKKPSYYKAFDGKIYTTDEQTFKDILAGMKQNIQNEYYNKLNGFTMSHEVPVSLAAPQKLSDFSWSPGWWDIRDWCEYYTLLTGEVPSYTMKWYSRNDEKGCVPVKTIKGHEDEQGDCWLIIKNNRTGIFNLQHGRGVYNQNSRVCTLHSTRYQAGGGYITEKVLDESGQYIKKTFVSPYSGCNDDHTYIRFLEEDIKRNGNSVYFYNPQFPSYASLDDLINDQIEKELNEYINSGTLNYVDWREIIYQMALDFYQHNQEDNFSLDLANNNRQFYPNGITGYEQYYIDMEKSWRSLYNPNPPKNSSDYYLSGERKGWNKNVYERPEMLDFWIDFLDTEGELQQFNVKNIGPRTKSINDNNIKSIYFRETPEVLFVKTMNDASYDVGNYRYIQYPDDSMFTISSQGQSAKNKLDELLYQHGYCAESASITCIPIYYLEPNTRIYVHDDRSKVNGDYIITQISLPLTYNGTMQLTVTKAAETII